MTTPYRHILTARESGQWHHCNPDMAKWRRNQIIERVSDDAIAMGYHEWRIYDNDERELAQGRKTDQWVE